MPIIIREQVFSATVGEESPDQSKASNSVQEVDLETIVNLCTKKVLQKIKAKEER